MERPMHLLRPNKERTRLDPVPEAMEVLESISKPLTVRCWPILIGHSD